MLKQIRYIVLKLNNIYEIKGRAARLPHVPDAGEIKPLPPKLASNVTGENTESCSGGV